MPIRYGSAAGSPIQVWNETQWPDEPEYTSRLAENVSHGICNECQCVYFGMMDFGDPEMLMVLNRLPQRFLLHAERSEQGHIIVRISDADHYPRKDSTEILGMDGGCVKIVNVLQEFIAVTATLRDSAI